MLWRRDERVNSGTDKEDKQDQLVTVRWPRSQRQARPWWEGDSQDFLQASGQGWVGSS